MRRRFYVTQYAAIFNGQNRLLLVRAAETIGVKGRWVFPGGHIENEIDPIAALQREVKEETNLKLKEAKPFRIVIKKYPKGWTMVIYYKCRATGKIMLDHENDAYKWIALEDVKKMKFRDDAEKKIIMQLLGERK